LNVLLFTELESLANHHPWWRSGNSAAMAVTRIPAGHPEYLKPSQRCIEAADVILSKDLSGATIGVELVFDFGCALWTPASVRQAMGQLGSCDLR
jgi:hypothetical protein